MSPGDTPYADAGGQAQSPEPISQKRAIASKLRAARKREFAMLRQRMRAGENTPSTVAGLRGRAARELPLSNQTLEKIERIGAHLEELWSPGAVAPEDTLTPVPVGPAAPLDAPVTEASPSKLAPSAWMATSEWRQPITQLADPAALTPLLDFPDSGTKPPAVPVAVPGIHWGQDPFMQELAGLFALGNYPAVQTLLLSTLCAHNERSAATYVKALSLLDTYRLLGDMDGFDDTVMAYVHWWNGLTPTWQPLISKGDPSGWVLHGDVKGAKGLQLAELDRNETAHKIDIDCSALLHMDQPAVLALVQWLGRAKTRNYEVQLSAPSALVYVLWVTMGVDKVAQVRTSF